MVFWWGRRPLHPRHPESAAGSEGLPHRQHWFSARGGPDPEVRPRRLLCRPWRPDLRRPRRQHCSSARGGLRPGSPAQAPSAPLAATPLEAAASTGQPRAPISVRGPEHVNAGFTGISGVQEPVGTLRMAF
ncbi:hypothetical protein NDU88_005902 [Pleurodeles waltl]|uniref:Uncharacterized protein n=1 Tax=Pleurodeles waltl TaxID=8319 RepID=A0AAV7TV99_PLEWA|nr:hypothetical protein NDU88_005902 [Pleurodeles waltl]